MQKARIISVEITDTGEGLFHATSPQMRELFVSGESADEALRKVPEAIEGLYALDGLTVCAMPADSQDLPIPEPWVILDSVTAAANC